MGHREKVSKGWVVEKKVSKGWVIEWWQFAGTTDPLTGLARNSNLPLDTSNNTRRSDRRQIATRQALLLLSSERNWMCIWNLQSEGCGASCTLYIEPSTIITVKKTRLQYWRKQKDNLFFNAKSIARIGSGLSKHSFLHSSLWCLGVGNFA